VTDDYNVDQIWIPISEAAAMLSGTDEDVRRLIRIRRFGWHESDNTVRLGDVITVLELREFDAVIDAGGSEKEARKRAEAVRARWEEGEKGPIENCKLKIDNCKLETGAGDGNWFEGLEWVSIKQACARLGVSERHMYDLLQERLNSEKRYGRRWILKEDVEGYARLQKVWEEKGGRWTAYGRREKREGAGGRLQVAGPDRRVEVWRYGGGRRGREGVEERHTQFSQEVYWITAGEAAGIMNVTETYVHILARVGRLTRVRGERPGPGRPNVKQRSDGTWFLMDEVVRFRDIREGKRRTISPAEWKRDLRHPVIRTELVAPPGDELIPSREAARILGIHKQRVGAMVTEGKLFGWQKEPGKSGSRLWLSLNQVCRYAQRPERLKCRAAWEKRRMDGRGTLNGWEDLGIDEHYLRLPSKSTKRDFGEFFTTRQAAIVMKVGPQCVRALRERGRLPGYRKPIPDGKYASKRAWWFFRKDDVYNLLADRDYRRNRKKATGVDVDMGVLE
jgi:hypothetical protein